PENTKSRRNLVLNSMYDCGYITKQECETASSEPLRIKLGGQASSSRYPYFLGAVSMDLNANPWEGMDPADLENGGLRITTTVDPAIQEICERVLREKLVDVEKMWVERKESRHTDEMKEWNGTLKPGDTKLMYITKILRPSATDDHTTHVCVELDKYRGEFALPEDLPYYNPSLSIKTDRWIDVYVQEADDSTGRIKCRLGDERPVQGSIVVLDAHNGDVLALVGGSNYYNEQWHGRYNRAIQGGRQVGSCFKPFFYAAAFEPERGFTPADIIVDEPIEYGGNPPYRPVNYERAERGEEAFAGPMTLIKALEHSRNVVAIRLFEALGVRRALDVVRRFDFTQSFGGSNHWQIDNQGMALPLGTINVTAYQIAAAYQVFANLGIGIRPQLVNSVINSKGVALPRPKRTEQPVVDPVTAYQVQYLMRQVVISGTGQREIGKYFKSPPAPPICGKTGTTNDSVDAWFVGFTPDLVIAVQVGFDTPRPMGHGMNGGPVAGPIWAAVLKNVLQTRPKNAWRTTFDAPPGISLVNICAATGKRAGDFCAAGEHQIYYNVPFRAGQEPSEVCDGTGAPRTPIIQPVGSEYAGFICRIHGVAHAVTN
ncbi:hypothetical protein LLG95_14980, partial [bacterium]|nr:hypothetical protein [bacterium]